MKIIVLSYLDIPVCKASHIEVVENVMAALSNDLYDYNKFETEEIDVDSLSLER